MSYQNLLLALVDVKKINQKADQTQAHEARCPICNSSSGLKLAEQDDGLILINAFCCQTKDVEIIRAAGLSGWQVFKQKTPLSHVDETVIHGWQAVVRLADDFEFKILILETQLFWRAPNTACDAAHDLLTAIIDIKKMSSRLQEDIFLKTHLPEIWPAIAARVETLLAAADRLDALAETRAGEFVAPLAQAFKAAGRKYIREVK